MNDEKFNYLGITKWHDAGYYGNNITIASRESLTTHGKKVLDVINQICPQARILYKQEYQKKVEPGIDIYTTSYFQGSDAFPKNQNKSLAMFKEGVFLCCAIGNDADESNTILSSQKHWCSVGACNLSNGKPIRMSYSSMSPDLDYMSFTNMETSYGKFTGTSCAAPVFASMLVLVQEFFKKQCGRKLSNSELLDFINDNIMDIGKEGFDNETGNGVFILPDPATIDIKKYLNADAIIELTIGSTKARINGKDYTLDTEPMIYCDRTLVPVRFIAEALQCEVYWDNERRKVFIIK